MSLPQPAAGSNSPTNLPTSSESSPWTSPQPVDRRPRGPPGSPRRRNPTIPGLRRGRMPGRGGMICVLHLCCRTSRMPVLLGSERAEKKPLSWQHAGPGVSVLQRRKPPLGPRQQHSAIAPSPGLSSRLKRRCPSQPATHRSLRKWSWRWCRPRLRATAPTDGEGTSGVGQSGGHQGRPVRAPRTPRGTPPSRLPSRPWPPGRTIQRAGKDFASAGNQKR